MMLLSLSSSEEALGLRGIFAVSDVPCHVSPGECGVVLESAFELRDPGWPAADGAGDRLEADAGGQSSRPEVAADRDGFGADQVQGHVKVSTLTA